VTGCLARRSTPSSALLQAELPGVATFFGFFSILIVVGGVVLFTYWISKDE
jgi:hypothetical protein